MNERETPPGPRAGGRPDEQRLDRFTWEYLEKRACECTEAELQEVIARMRARTAELNQQIAEDQRRTQGAELKIAAVTARIDQYRAWVDHGLACCNWYANGGV